MNRTKHRSESYLEFRALLRQWTRVVDHYAYRRRRPQPIASTDYPVLHSELAGACREQLAEAGETEAEAIKRLVELIAPWVSLESLASSRTQILADLSVQCSAVEYVLDGGKSHAVPWSRIALVSSLLLLVLLGVVLAGMGSGSDQSLAVLVDRGQRALREFIWSIRHANFFGRFALITAIVVSIGILLLTKGLRKWT